MILPRRMVSIIAVIIPISLVIGWGISYEMTYRDTKAAIRQMSQLNNKSLAEALLREQFQIAKSITETLFIDGVQRVVLTTKNHVLFSTPESFSGMSCEGDEIEMPIMRYGVVISNVKICMSGRAIVLKTFSSPLFWGLVGTIVGLIVVFAFGGLLNYRRALLRFIEELEAEPGIHSKRAMTKDPVLLKLVALLHDKMTAQSQLRYNKAIAQASQNIAHDLKNPIHTIELAMEPGSTEEQRRASIHAALGKLKYMVEKFRNADIDGIIHPQWLAADWERILNDAQPAAQKSHVALHLGDCLQTPVCIDHDKIERALMNLLRNAIESGARNVWLAANACGTELVLRITDDGPGVPGEILPRLFERGVTSGKPGGSGLGLNYVREIARGHGGDAKYTRERGQSVFEVSLPGVVERLKVAGESPVSIEEPPASARPRDISLKHGKLCIMLKLTNASVESEVSRRIHDAYPNVELSGSIMGISFIWSDQPQFVTQAASQGIAGHLLPDSDDTEKIYTIIAQKLSHLSRGIT